MTLREQFDDIFEELHLITNDHITAGEIGEKLYRFFNARLIKTEDDNYNKLSELNYHIENSRNLLVENIRLKDQIFQLTTHTMERNIKYCTNNPVDISINLDEIKSVKFNN